MKKIVITIEEDENTDMSYSNWNVRQQYNDPCEHCSNNPRNNPHASGMCSCALPALANPIF